jgi:hypothetical protein
MNAPGLAVVAAIVCLVLSPAVSQTAGGGGQNASAPTSWGGCPAESLAFHSCALEKAKTFDPPRTPGGRPDLQGYWRSRLAMDVSVEGVSETEPLTRRPVMPWPIGPGMIVDPPDRKIPYQPWAAEVGRKGRNHDKYIDPRTACSSGGVPRLALQDANQLLQPWDEDYVLWVFEDHHVTRVITMDGRPPTEKDIKLWNGESHGHWEGNTLVVDVTNLNGYAWLDDAGDFYTDAAHVVERLTMIDRDTIHYEITIEDPKAYTRQWTMVWALVREKDPGFELLEEACWEGEQDLPRFLELGYRHYFGETWKAR